LKTLSSLSAGRLANATLTNAGPFISFVPPGMQPATRSGSSSDGQIPVGMKAQIQHPVISKRDGPKLNSVVKKKSGHDLTIVLRPSIPFHHPTSSPALQGTFLRTLSLTFPSLNGNDDFLIFPWLHVTWRYVRSIPSSRRMADAASENLVRFEGKERKSGH
jgi:hypothetical protein